MMRIIASSVAVAGMIAASQGVQAALVVDFDAAQGITDDGAGGVTGWQASGAVTPTATSSAGSSPTLVNGVFGGGQPGVYFNGVDQRLEYSDAGHPAGSSSFTLAMAFKFESLTPFGSNPNNWGTWFRWGDRDGGGSFGRVGMGSSPQGHFRAFNGGGIADAYLDSLEGGKNYVGILVHDESVDANDISVYLLHENGMDSNANTTFNHGPTDIVLKEGVIGNILPVGDAGWGETSWNGYVGRIQIYDTALRGAELDSLMSTMNAYGVVPEPGTFALLCLGFGLAARRGFRRA